MLGCVIRVYQTKIRHGLVAPIAALSELFSFEKRKSECGKREVRFLRMSYGLAPNPTKS